jgi:hypothetical protein
MLPMNRQEVGHPDANPLTQMIWANTLITLLLAVPSLSVMVLLRRKIGYRTLQPWMLMLAFLALFAMGAWSLISGSFASRNLGVTNALMLIIAFVMAASGFAQRRGAWKRIATGARWHTKSRGISFLAALPFPEHVVQRFVEPIFCIVAGFILMPTVSVMLGLWLAFSGACLGVLEGIIYDVQLNKMLDQLDGLVEAEVAAENNAFFSQGQTERQTPGIESMAGITVGFAPELQHLVNKRLTAKAASA